MSRVNSRRQFLLKAGASGVAVISAQAMTAGNNAWAAEAVDPNSPQALALGYVEDATTTDTAKFARYEAGQECANCQLYQASADADEGGCILFAGKSVKARGWCNSWAKKAG